MARLNASKSWLASCLTAVLNSCAGAGVLANEHTRSAAQAIHHFRAKHEGSRKPARFGLRIGVTPRMGFPYSFTAVASGLAAWMVTPLNFGFSQLPQT